MVLIGFMGAGKTTAAAELAKALSVEAIDTDREIERRLGHTVAQEFEAAGEEAFRRLEEQVVLQALSSAPEGAVLSLGGGSVLSARVREALAGWVTVLLDVDVQTAWERATAGAAGEAARPGGSEQSHPQGTEGAAGAGGGGAARSGEERPLARDWEAFRALYEQRREIYEAVADAIVPARTREAAVAALPGIVALKAAPEGTRMVWASARSGSYPVLVREGLVTRGMDLERWLGLSGRRFCVTDANVGGLYGDRAGETAARIEIPAGERAKTIETAISVWERLMEEGMTRGDHVLALGGGVVGDLAGFCAATYQRGVPVVQVPTTVVAQVDSAYGGKTGVDLPKAKNYVGAYHQPAAVIVDPTVLGTLPERELAAGWVEVVKTALIAGGELWERVAASGRGTVEEDVIVACARAKLRVVEEDERDGGARQALNLGHTIGHAIESATGYGRYLHGEAVGLGLLAALRLSGADELRERVRGILAEWGLPVQMAADVDGEQVLAATAYDKKRTGRQDGGQVPFVLLERPGEVRVGLAVDRQSIAAAIAELQGSRP